VSPTVEPQDIVWSGAGAVRVEILRRSHIDAGRDRQRGTATAVDRDPAPVRDQVGAVDGEPGLGERTETGRFDEQRDLAGAAVLWPGEDEFGDSVQGPPGAVKGAEGQFHGDQSPLNSRRYPTGAVDGQSHHRLALATEL
jgi:hypothetical protein